MKTQMIWLSASLLALSAAAAQDDEAGLSSELLSGMEWRSIGPAFMSGRIADIEIVPDDPATWYVGVGSGGVWKTKNAGTTWTPLFDEESSYSIGEIALDPHNSDTIWVGTGENHGGRHIAYGDGVYRSTDGGENWENLGLEESEHISKIIVHPEDPDTVFVASQGPLWSKGGQRGLFKTTDGGKTWDDVLSAGEWTGVTDLMMDPRNPDRLYAATWQRHRTVASYIGGGPESGLHMSEDGGETWTELTEGLPEGNMGKIGLAMSPQDPDRLYAAIELDRRQGGIWMSSDRGASWTKQSDTVSGGTGPHYYQELYASPHKEGQIILLSNYTQVSNDHGKTFEQLNNDSKHVDDHALAFRPDDPDYIIIGSDGGIYESYDNQESWRFIDNLPITQFYKVAVDDKEPFYTVYGGTQDNNSQGGPSRTANVNGIRNSDWFVTLGGDGHQSATEPGNPDIMYAQWQQGNLTRVDRTTGETVYVKPHAAPGEGLERFNWDAPILVSSHDPKRLYFASQRVWRSDDRGDSWEAISGDLTRDEDRMQLPVMDRKWSWDAGWDYLAMSNYNTITSLAESPFDEDLIYAGTDDGIVQVTEDGGRSWRQIEAGTLPGVPETAFVNDIRADIHDEDTVYLALDNHKYGDYAPYLLKSEDRGETWTSLAEDLPDRHLVWRIVQDHEKPELLFAATEFGAFMSPNGGESWTELDAGMPTISLRDITIQRREDDLVAASFGRGFYILDDIAPLRDIDADALEEEAMLWPEKEARWYIQEKPLGDSGRASQGHGYFTADNPPFGATFTYYLRDGFETREAERQRAEEEALEAGDDTPFPGFETIAEEMREEPPYALLTVRNEEGDIVRSLTGPVEKGVHRVTWDLTRPDRSALTSLPEEEEAEEGEAPSGVMVAPGRYTVDLAVYHRGRTKELVSAASFEVVPLRKGALAGASPEEAAEFWNELADMDARLTAANETLDDVIETVDLLDAAMKRSRADNDLRADVMRLRMEVMDLRDAMRGNPAMNEIGQQQAATIEGRLRHAKSGTLNSTYGPTQTHKEAMRWAEDRLAEVSERLNELRRNEIPKIERDLAEAGAPWTPGADIPAR